MNTRLLAEALRAFANALETPADPVQTVQQPANEPAAAPSPPKRGRGRPVVGEAPAAPAASPAPDPEAPAPNPPASLGSALTTAEADPFASGEETVVIPAATLDDVRTALTALRDATDQQTAVAILKTIGQADNLSALKPGLYGLVAAAAKAAIPPGTPDPFAAPAPVAEAAPAVEVKPEPTLEDVKNAIVRVQKRASTEVAQKIVMEHGGKAAGVNGVMGPSLKALPLDKIAACLKALDAVPATK